MYGFYKCPKCKKEFYAPNAWGYISKGRKCCSWSCKRALDAVKAAAKINKRGKAPEAGSIKLTEAQAQEFRRRIAAIGINIATVGRGCGITSSAVSNWLCGRTRLSGCHAEQLERFLIEKEKSLAAATD